MYVALNIGRNINGKPMPMQEWLGMQVNARVALTACIEGMRANGAINGEENGGQWAADAPEESSHIWAVCDSVNEESLKTNVRIIARAYCQDAIAVIIGESTLVG